MSSTIGRQIATFAMLGLGVGLGFAVIDAVFGSRKIHVQDTYPQQQQPLQQQQYQQQPSIQQQSYQYQSQPQARDDCSLAMTALLDCESRNGIGATQCKFFRQRVEECGMNPR